MSTVAVVGASQLGGAVAHRLAVQPSVREVRVIDSSGSVARGIALDIQQSGAVERFDTRVDAGDSIHDMVGADIIVLAGPAGAAALEWDEDGGLTVLERVACLNHHAVTVCAGSTHRTLVERGVTRTSLARERLVGSAPYALACAMQAIVALELRCSPNDVSLTVLGKPPEQLVVPWSGVSVSGVSITALLGPHGLSSIQQRVDLLWPPGPYALAAAVGRLCDAILKGTAERGFPCYVVLDGELGVKNSAFAVSAALDRTGVTRIREPALSVRERTLLDTAIGT